MGLDPVGDDREHRVGALDGPVCDDEAGNLTQRALATPVLDRVVVAPAAHDHRASVFDEVAEHLLEHRGIVERPVVKPHAVLAEALLGGVVRRCDVAVQRHAHVDHHVAHVALLVRTMRPAVAHEPIAGAQDSGTIGRGS
jgi:hypothetical protein